MLGLSAKSRMLGSVFAGHPKTQGPVYDRDIDLAEALPDQQPWLLASFAAGAMLLGTFAAISTGFSVDRTARTSVPMMTAGWQPGAKLARPHVAQAPKARVLLAAAQTAPHDVMQAEFLLGPSLPPATPSLDALVSDPNPVVTTISPTDIEDQGEPDVERIVVEKGDTLSEILAQAGASEDAVPAVMAALKPVFDPGSIRAGQALTLTFGRPAFADARAGAGPQLLSLAFKPSIERDIQVHRTDGGGYEAKEIIRKLTERIDRSAGVIRGSLYQSAMASGMPEGAINDLIRVFSHDVDFQRDIKAGDKFDILYTRHYDDEGNPVKAGTLIQATLTLGREKKTLYRFTNPEDQGTDYYTPAGWSGKRALMKTPVDGARMSSGYGMRWHPILGYNKMHRGIDFAAPKGTPIVAAGHGVVEVAGVAGGYGNYIRLRHQGQFKTAYAHLSRFARGIKAGAKVRQGQLIGYVGSTGRSTGPHLHYEVLMNDRHVNPTDVKLPTGTTLTGKAMAAFKAEKARIDALIQKTPLVGAVALGTRNNRVQAEQ